MLEILVGKTENNKKEIGLIENGNLVEYYLDEEEFNRNEGNIYVGLIKDVIKGMDACFVDVGTKKNGFIHLKDLMPKIDETKEKLDLNVKINEIAKTNQKILVQIKKDSNSQKGAKLSTHINLPSKYIVLMPDSDIITISQKIEDKKEQDRLKELVKNNISKGYGAIVRTSSIGKTDEIIKDLKNMENKWQKILNEYKNYKLNSPKLIQRAEGIVEKMIMDLPEDKLERVIVSDKNEYEKLKNYKEENSYFCKTKIELRENEDIFDIYDVKKQIEKLKNRKIWLKCGGFITIDKTEALTAIDVNTGKYTGKKSVEQTMYKVNEEATIEIAKQLRLRDIGGIIIIDYIDMEDKKDKEKIEKLLKERLKNDRNKTQVEGFTKLDLMEMTRKHICSHNE